MGTTVVAPVQRQFFTLFALYFYVTHQRFHTFVYNEQDVTQIGYGTVRLGLLLKNGSQFCFGLDTKTFFETQFRYLINNESKDTKRHHVVFVERAKKRASFLMYTPLCEVAFFPFFLH